MARVTGFEKQNIHSGRPHPTETQCEYAIFEHDGHKFLQISSTGSKDRRKPGHVTQTYQFDSNSARELRRIIGVAFPELA